MDPALLMWRGALEATPAHLAASHGHLPSLQLLAYACPAALAARDMRGSTPLHYAALHGRLDVVAWVRIDSTCLSFKHDHDYGHYDYHHRKFRFNIMRLWSKVCDGINCK
jgi:hypothetical protein